MASATRYHGRPQKFSKPASAREENSSSVVQEKGSIANGCTFCGQHAQVSCAKRSKLWRARDYFLQRVLQCGRNGEKRERILVEPLLLKVEEDADDPQFVCVDSSERYVGVKEAPSTPVSERVSEADDFNYEKPWGPRRPAFTWMFVFPLPSAVTAAQQKVFQQKLDELRTTSFEGVSRAFEDFVQPDDIKQMMSSETSYNAHVSETHLESVEQDAQGHWTFRARLHGRIKSLSHQADDGTGPGPRMDDTKEPDDSLRRALRCTIDLVHVFLRDLDISFEETIRDGDHKNSVANGIGSTTTRGNLLDVSKNRDRHHVHVFSHKPSKDKLSVCVDLGRDAAELLADFAEYPVQLDRECLREPKDDSRSAQGDKPKKPFLGVAVPPEELHQDTSCFGRWSGLGHPDHSPAYAKYDSCFRDKCREFDDSSADARGGGTTAKTILRPIDRIRLLYDRITDSVDLAHLENLGLLEHSFPLHHQEQLQKLRKDWGTFSETHNPFQPVNQIRDYFGEEVAFYFIFVQHLIRCVAFLAIPAVGCSLWHGTGTSSFTMSIIIMLWYFCCAKTWQRHEANTINRWGLDQHAVSTIKPLPNPRFTGKLMKSPENELEETFQVPRKYEVIGRTAALLVTSLFVVFMVAVNAVEFYVFYMLSKRYTSSDSQSFLAMGIGLFSGIQIRAVDSIWDWASMKITDLELRAYVEDFYWSKSIKTSVVRFINTMSLMAFFAFVRPLIDTISCDDGEDCMAIYRETLSTKLTTIFFTRFFLLSVFNDLVRPYLDLFRAEKRAHSDSISSEETQQHLESIEERFGSIEKQFSFTRELIQHQLSFTREISDINHDIYNQWQRQSCTPGTWNLDDGVKFATMQLHMDTYRNSDLTNDYLDILLPLSFVVLFGMVNPLSVVGYLVILMLQVRQDAWKLTYLYRRPFPRLVKTIGSFNGVLAAVGNMMIFCNLGFLFVDYDVAAILFQPFGIIEDSEITWSVRALVFTVGAMILTLLWHFIDFVVGDTSSYAHLEQRRQNLQRHHLFFNAGANHDLRLRRVVVTPTKTRHSTIKSDARVSSKNTPGSKNTPRNSH